MNENAITCLDRASTYEQNKRFFGWENTDGNSTYDVVVGGAASSPGQIRGVDTVSLTARIIRSSNNQVIIRRIFSFLL